MWNCQVLPVVIYFAWISQDGQAWHKASEKAHWCWKETHLAVGNQELSSCVLTLSKAAMKQTDAYRDHQHHAKDDIVNHREIPIWIIAGCHVL